MRACCVVNCKFANMGGMAEQFAQMRGHSKLEVAQMWQALQMLMRTPLDPFWSNQQLRHAHVCTIVSHH